MGDEATLTLAGTDQRTCRVNRGLQAARERGVDYRAVGQEPGWVLDIISGDRFILEYAYGEKRLEAPWTKPDRLPAAKSHGGGLQYDAQSDSGRLTVVILDKPCQDAMSGRDYPDTVHVTLGDMRLSGCGRGL